MNNGITLASACYQFDYELILKTNYIDKLFCASDEDLFTERLLVVNNVNDRNEVENLVKHLIDNQIISRYIFVQDVWNEALKNLGRGGATRFVYRKGITYSRNESLY